MMMLLPGSLFYFNIVNKDPQKLIAEAPKEILLSDLVFNKLKNIISGVASH